MSEADARRGMILNTAGGRVGLLGVMEGQAHWRFLNLSFANDAFGVKWPGVARLVPRDTREDIERLRPLCDVLVAVVHWGKNYEGITEDQERLARFFVAAGVDVVIGHHSHEAHPVGLIDGRPVVYSLGNYAFNSPRGSLKRFGLAVALHLERGRLSALEFVPLQTQNRVVRFRPRIPRGSDLEAFFRWFTTASGKRGARLERRGDRAWMTMEPAEGLGTR